MSDIQLRSDFDVELVDHMGTDQAVCDAARVSTLGAAAIDTEESAGLINFLMKNRHGSPFEHGAMKFRITAPIFVWREFMRHRIGFSYNEQSGRYMEMLPVFYIPPRHRNFVQVGKPGHYSFVPGDEKTYVKMTKWMRLAYGVAWFAYKTMLMLGIAKEVARNVLPVATYSTAYVTCNPRSMMSFLSLRTKSEASTFPSYPQWEIEMVAGEMEAHFMNLYPLTWEAFHKNGRVSP